MYQIWEPLHEDTAARWHLLAQRGEFSLPLRQCPLSRAVHVRNDVPHAAGYEMSIGLQLLFKFFRSLYKLHDCCLRTSIQINLHFVHHARLTSSNFDGLSK